MISLGFRTLLVKEVRRFLRVPGQTLATPLVTTTLYFIVFGVSIGHQLREVGGACRWFCLPAGPPPAPGRPARAPGSSELGAEA